MAQLFVPLTDGMARAAGSGFNPHGENLDRPLWRGCEIGFLDTFPDVWGAVTEAEFHDWIIGVHHPLYKAGGPQWCRFFDRDPAVRERALEIAGTAAQAAHHVGARYILFHFPWPGFLLPGVDLEGPGLGWYYGHPLERLEDWSEAEVREVSRRAFERFESIQENEKINVVLEVDGPSPYFFDGELYSRLFEEHPGLSLCLDTGRLGLLARTHGQDPMALARRWLPWTRHLHLHTSGWTAEGRFFNHIPTTGADTAERWPHLTPAADIARLVVGAQPRCTVVLEHDPRKVSPAELEEAHAWAAALVGEGL